MSFLSGRRRQIDVTPQWTGGRNIKCVDLVVVSIKGFIMIKAYINRFASDESGATAIEYGLIASLIAVVIIGSVTILGTKLTATFTAVSASLK